MSLGLLLAVVGAIVSLASSAGDDPQRALTSEETLAGIQTLWTEFSPSMSTAPDAQVGAVYARYSTRFQSSIFDQVRACLEYAVQNRIVVPLENIFFDIGVSGRKRKRPGLDKLEVCLEGKQVGVLIVFSTNRLFRRSLYSQEFVNVLVKEQRKRIVFVAGGIDSEKDEQWSRFLQFLTLFDEFSAEMYVNHIRSAHVGKLRNREVHGTLPIGFHGVEIPGGPNRNGKRPRRIEIHSEHAALVKQVFEWFVDQGMSINTIVRKLNSIANVPLPPMSTTGRWTRLAVTNLLTNERYRGVWHYGKTESVLLSKQDYVRRRDRVQPLATVQFENLRIISDDVFYRARKRFIESKTKACRGRHSQRDDSRKQPRILNGLLYCSVHNQRMHATGYRAEYMTCPQCYRESGNERVLFTQLNRAFALNKVCCKLGSLILEDENLVEQIIEFTGRWVESITKPDPDQIQRLREETELVRRYYGNLLRMEPQSNAEEGVLNSVLREKRFKLAQLESQLAVIETANAILVTVPTPEEVRDRLSSLADVLRNVLLNGSPEQLDESRELLRRLTGGRIELTQQGERKSRKGWLRGTFRAPLVRTIAEMLSGVEMPGDESGLEVVIDFDRPRSDAERVERANELYRAGKMHHEIATILECSRSNVTRLLKRAAEENGVPFEDGRKRRATLEKKQQNTPQYQAIADQAAELWNRGTSYCAIARQLGCSDVTAEKAIRYWHESRGLPVPTAKTRREQLRAIAHKQRAEGASTPEIARSLGVSTTTVRGWLKTSA